MFTTLHSTDFSNLKKNMCLCIRVYLFDQSLQISVDSPFVSFSKGNVTPVLFK